MDNIYKTRVELDWGGKKYLRGGTIEGLKQEDADKLLKDRLIEHVITIAPQGNDNEALTKERDELKAANEALTKERDELKAENDKLKKAAEKPKKE
jgi:hypothetical protein